MRRVFLDTDLILDLLSARKPHVYAARQIFSAIDQRKIEGCVSSLSFANLHYILRKSQSRLVLMQTLEKLRALLIVLPVDDKVVALALASNFKDFEDALQHYTALQGGADCLLTRNVKDYKSAELPVMSPQDFVDAGGV